MTAARPALLERVGYRGPVLLRYHPTFEEELAASLEGEAPSTSPSGVVMEVHRLLAPLLQVLAGADACVLATPLSASAGSVPPLSCTNGTSLSLEQAQQRAYLPWGLTPTTRAEATSLTPAYVWPSHEAVCRVQSRVFSLALEQRLGIALPGAEQFSTRAALERGVAAQSGAFVLKHPFGVAGRARVFGAPERGGLSPGAWRWCEKVLAHHPLILEPWVERVQDFGTQFWIPEQGPSVHLGTLELLNEPNGTFRGHQLPALREDQLPPGLLSWGLKVCEAVREAGYWGPLGLDSFTHLAAEGVRLRPLVELNARLTMGMVGLGLAELLPPGMVGDWRMALLSGKQQAEKRARLSAWAQAGERLLCYSPAGLEEISMTGLESRTEGIFIRLHRV